MNDATAMDGFYWLFVLTGFIAFLIGGDLVIRTSTRTLAWWRARRVRRSVEALRTMFGERLNVRPLNESHLNGCVNYQHMQKPQEKLP